jgi:hypothetical protein
MIVANPGPPPGYSRYRPAFSAPTNQPIQCPSTGALSLSNTIEPSFRIRLPSSSPSLSRASMARPTSFALPIRPVNGEASICTRFNQSSLP